MRVVSDVGCTFVLNHVTDHKIRAVRKLAEDLCLEDGPLAKKCEEFERLNRSVLADGR